MTSLTTTSVDMIADYSLCSYKIVVGACATAFILLVAPHTLPCSVCSTTKKTTQNLQKIHSIFLTNSYAL